jgi:hypothetical protein
MLQKLRFTQNVQFCKYSLHHTSNFINSLFSCALGILITFHDIDWRMCRDEGSEEGRGAILWVGEFVLWCVVGNVLKKLRPARSRYTSWPRQRRRGIGLPPPGLGSLNRNPIGHKMSHKRNNPIRWRSPRQNKVILRPRPHGTTQRQRQLTGGSIQFGIRRAPPPCPHVPQNTNTSLVSRWHCNGTLSANTSIWSHHQAVPWIHPT